MLGTILQQSDYTSDAFDRRIIKSFDDDGPGPHSASITKTLYDGPDFAANPYADLDGSNNLAMRYLYGPTVDFILARRNASGTAAWYLADHLATVRDQVNTGGTVQDHISYSAHGKVNAESQPANGDRFKFTGREYDSETADHYYRARYHDGATGRFISLEPITCKDADITRGRIRTRTIRCWGKGFEWETRLACHTAHETTDRAKKAKTQYQKA